jgi:hypothetical protein
MDRIEAIAAVAAALTQRLEAASNDDERRFFLGLNAPFMEWFIYVTRTTAPERALRIACELSTELAAEVLKAGVNV